MVLAVVLAAALAAGVFQTTEPPGDGHVLTALDGSLGRWLFASIALFSHSRAGTP